MARLAERGPDGGLGLFPLDGDTYLGTAVAHAHLLARRDPGAALMLLAQATAYDPGKPWANVDWVRHAPLAGIDPQQLVRVLVTVVSGLSEPVAELLQRSNAAYLDLARRAIEAHPGHGLLHGAGAAIARRMGEPVLAVDWAERGVRLDPSKLTYTWYGYALKAADQLDEALDVMRRAREQNPLDLDLYADAANWLADAGRLDEAIVLTDEAMRVDPTYDCAVHTGLRLRFQRDGDPAHLIALSDFMREHPQQSHEHLDLQQVCGGRPWLGLVTGPTEACVNVLGQVPPQDRAAAQLTMTLSALEVPSALALLRRDIPGVEVTLGAAPPPDMVAPARPGRPLWRYVGEVAQPAFAPPSPRATELISNVATPFWPHPVAAYDQALPLGQLGVEALLCLLVHPPAPPARFAELPPAWWERSAQVFACLGLLHCQELSPGTPGDTTAQRRVLTEIAFGIEDWTTEAALFALTVAAWLDPACRDEVRDVVATRFLDAAKAARERVVTILDSLARLVLIVPGIPPEVAALAHDLADQDS